MGRRRSSFEPPSLIDLDTLLNGSPTWDQVAAFFKDGEFYEEHYVVEAIERWLLTPEQKQELFDAGLSIEKMLNGRHGDMCSVLVDMMYANWNAKLGFTHFLSPLGTSTPEITGKTPARQVWKEFLAEVSVLRNTLIPMETVIKEDGRSIITLPVVQRR